jgi:sulfonate transport system substrate-binding protein
MPSSPSRVPVVLACAWLVAAGAAAGASGCRDTQASSPPGSRTGTEADPPAELRLDYATYNLSSVVLHRQGWVEQELGPRGIAVRWVLSQGSNKANEMLASGALDLASTAGASALLARSNGVPLKIVYV